MTARDASVPLRRMLNKVPEVTIFFWIIKVLCTTIGETAADYLNETLHFGLTGTSVAMGVLLAVALVAQFRAKKYIPSLYWLTVMLVSVVGTLITDNLTDGMGVPLELTTAVFAVALVIVFATWFAVERTLSVHEITTVRRESFYWSAILVTFALGTAAGDLIAEKYAVGYFPSILLWGGLIAIVGIGHYVSKAALTARGTYSSARAVFAFWAAYIFTRPLGASIGDFLTQAHSDGGLGLGTTATTVLFTAAIVALVIFLTATKKDQVTQVA